MQVSVEKSAGLERKLTVQVPGEQLQQKIDAKLRELGKQVRIKGFRPGKVPFKVLQQRYGKSVQQEIIAEEVQHSLGEAIRKESLRLASSPVLDAAPEFEPGGELRYTATLEVFPEIAAIEAGKLNIKSPQAEVTEQDIDEMLETLRKQRRTLKDTGAPVTSGNQVTVEYSAETEQGRVPERGRQRISVSFGDSGFDTLERALEGLQAGAETSAELSFPADYQDAKLAGRTVQAELKLTKVQQVEMPEVDAAFIQSFGVESGEMSDMRQEIRNNLERELKQASTSYLKRQLVDRLLELHPELQVPEAMVREEASSLQRQAASRAGKEPDPKQVEPFLEVARQRVKGGLLLSEIARQNSLIVDGARVRAAIETVAQTYEQPEDVVRLYYNEPRLLNSVENAVLEEQVVDWALEKAKVTAKPMSFNDVINLAARGEREE